MKPDKIIPSQTHTREHTVIALTELTSALAKFVNENFKGVMHVSARCTDEDKIKILPEYIVYFLVRLVKATRAECYFEVKAETREGMLSVSHNSSSALRIDERDAASLAVFAKEAGFQIELTESEVVLTKMLESAKKPISNIYVASSRAIYSDMCAALKAMNF